MSLKKPPLVEVWMSFRFEPAVGAPTWTRERYNTFLESVSEQYPDRQEMARRGIQVAASKRGKKPQVKGIVEQVLAMRAFTEDGLRTVQLTPDQLTVNYLRGEGSPYPGFAALLDEAMAHYRRYLECYKPLGTIATALHYVDLLEIPLPPDRIIVSEEYLTLNLQTANNSLGSFLSFDIKTLVKPSDGEGLVQLMFAVEPSREDDTYRRFRLEWHTGSPPGPRMAEDEVRANLQAAHDRLWKCFRQMFTAKGWALFEPENT